MNYFRQKKEYKDPHHHIKIYFNIKLELNNRKQNI